MGEDSRLLGSGLSDQVDRDATLRGTTTSLVLNVLRLRISSDFQVE